MVETKAAGLLNQFCKVAKVIEYFRLTIVKLPPKGSKT